MNWIFKSSELQPANNKEKAVVIITQKQNFRGKEGENVLILEKKKEGWEFTSIYKITSIAIKNLEEESKEITINLDLIKQFYGEKLLEDYVYSLHRVTNYVNPINHFNRKYNRLQDAEFEAIVQDKIYQKRTILGTVLNAMHSDHQRAFISYAASKAPELLVGKINMDIALKLLFSYLEFAVVKPAEYLRESAKILRSIITDEEYSEVGFGFDIEKLKPQNNQMIKPQVDLISKNLEVLSGYTEENEDLQILNFQANPKFEKLFRNSSLPINLK